MRVIIDRLAMERLLKNARKNPAQQIVIDIKDQNIILLDDNTGNRDFVNTQITVK